MNTIHKLKVMSMLFNSVMMKTSITTTQVQMKKMKGQNLQIKNLGIPELELSWP